jgi:putative alpha-1,2-mannosidase
MIMKLTENQRPGPKGAVKPMKKKTRQLETVYRNFCQFKIRNSPDWAHPHLFSYNYRADISTWPVDGLRFLIGTIQEGYEQDERQTANFGLPPLNCV